MRKYLLTFRDKTVFTFAREADRKIINAESVLVIRDATGLLAAWSLDFELSQIAPDVE